MENLKNHDPDQLPKTPVTNQEETEFENPSTDPGFEPSTPAEAEEEEDTQVDTDQDALNYENDREDGAYNPNII